MPTVIKRRESTKFKRGHFTSFLFCRNTKFLWRSSKPPYPFLKRKSHMGRFVLSTQLLWFLVHFPWSCQQTHHPCRIGCHHIHNGNPSVFTSQWRRDSQSFCIEEELCNRGTKGLCFLAERKKV